MHNIRRAAAARLAIAGLSLLSGGCAVSPLANRASAFGAAASLISKDASSAYDTVETTAYNAQVSSLVLDFDAKGFDPDKIKPFLSGDDLQARLVLLSALQRYATLLQDVAGTGPVDQLNTEVNGFGQQLKSLTANPALKKIAVDVNDSEIKGLTTAMDVVGQLLIERKRQKDLPPILVDMQVVIDRICAVLSADLGKPPDSNGIGGRGLRNQLWIEYDQLIENQKVYITSNKASLTAQEKAGEIAKLPALVKEQRSADAAFNATQTALGDLAKTHRALLTDPKKNMSFAGDIAEMQDDARRIADFYNSLKFK